MVTVVIVVGLVRIIAVRVIEAAVIAAVKIVIKFVVITTLGEVIGTILIVEMVLIIVMGKVFLG